MHESEGKSPRHQSSAAAGHLSMLPTARHGRSLVLAVDTNVARLRPSLVSNPSRTRGGSAVPALAPSVPGRCDKPRRCSLEYCLNSTVD
jgi:hypothetical protein